MARGTKTSSNNRSTGNRRSTSRSRNNNPTGRNQYSSTGVLELARDRPVAAAAVAAGAAAAGLFLWSKRTQISDQLSSLSDQIGEWTNSLTASDDSLDWEEADDTAGLTTASGITETDSASTSSTSGRGRASQPTVG